MDTVWQIPLLTVQRLEKKCQYVERKGQNNIDVIS
jgi:hypothetical protein